MKRILLGAIAAMALVAPVAHAQVVRGDQIVAQRSYGSRQQVAIPQNCIVVRAEFVLFSARYETDTRAADERDNELSRTFTTVTQRVGRTNGGVVIEVWSPGNSAAVETAAIKEVVMDEGERSCIDLVLKVAVKPNEIFDAIRARAEKYVADAPVAGRVELVIGDSQFLGVSEPEKHRETLVTAIANDVKLMQASFGGPNSPVRVNRTGMEQRAQTRPGGPLGREI